MKIAKVVGQVVSVVKVDSLAPAKLFLLQILDMELKLLDKYLIAVDSIGSAINDLVIFTTGSSARMTSLTSSIPTDTTIIARLDENYIKTID